MRRRRDIPTPEEIAEATGGNPEVIKRALEGLRFEDEEGDE